MAPRPTTGTRELGLSAFAIALAFGTKFSAVFALPILIAVAVVAQPRCHRRWRITAVAVGASAGVFWYVVNVLETGHLVGHEPESLSEVNPLTRALGGYARALDALEVTGVRDWGGYAYPALAALIAAVAIAGSRVVRAPLRPVSS